MAVGKATQYLGIFFIVVIKVLALMLAKERIKPYRTANGIDHILDIYADNLSIYL